MNINKMDDIAEIFENTNYENKRIEAKISIVDDLLKDNTVIVN